MGRSPSFPTGIQLTDDSCLKGVAWRELPPQKGILGPLPASSWLYLVKSGAEDRQVRGRRRGFREGHPYPASLALRGRSLSRQSFDKAFPLLSLG